MAAYAAKDHPAAASADRRNTVRLAMKVQFNQKTEDGPEIT